jgi:hypothetical protein
MGAEDQEDVNKQLLIHIFLKRLKFNELPGRIPPIYWYAGTFVFLDFGLINTYFHLFMQRPHGFLQNPFSLTIPVAVIIAAAGTRHMTINYQQALDQMNLWKRSNEITRKDYHKFTIPLPIRVAFYILVLAAYYGYIFGVIGLSSYVDAFGVVPFAVFVVIIYPLGYIPIIVDFVMQFVSTQFVLPRQISKHSPTLAFLDPRNLGGFYPIGKLLKETYYIYTVGLILSLVYIYGPTATGIGTAAVTRVGIVEAAVFTVLWGFGLVAVANSMFTIHRLMADGKESHLTELEKQLYNTISSPYDISSADLHDNPEVEQIQRRIEQVRAMKEYPTNPNTSAQLIISILTPELINLALNYIF